MYTRRIALAATVVAFGDSSALPQITTRISVATGGAQGNADSRNPSISADGRFVAFESYASNLVAGDTNNSADVFVHDRQTGETTRVSVTSGGTQGNRDSLDPSLSGDGRIVAFVSSASNLVAGDTNNYDDVFVHDRQTGQTTSLSVAIGGAQATGASLNPTISPDGRFVAFESTAYNLVPGDTNGWTDIFVRDRQTGQTTRVNVATGGAQANGPSHSSSIPISADGRFVAFASNAFNLVAEDTNGSTQDVFVRDLQLGQTALVSISTGGEQGNGYSDAPSISADGRWVVFSSASSLVAGDTNGSQRDVFARDRQTEQTTLVSVATGGGQGISHSKDPSLTADGRMVVFSSASRLDAGDNNGQWDIFAHDRHTEHTALVSVATGGAQGNRGSHFPSISANGRFVAFESFASNLVAGDTNDWLDVFVQDRCTPFPCAGDANGDGVVVFADITRVLENWGMDFVPCTGPGDADHNGVVNFSDITKVLENWATTCP